MNLNFTLIAQAIAFAILIWFTIKQFQIFNTLKYIYPLPCEHWKKLSRKKKYQWQTQYID